MSYHGDIALGATIDVKFTTVNTSGVPTQLAGTPAVAAYVDNGTTEITAGITLSVDFDSRTGLNNVRVVATSGNGFAAGTNVQLVITTGTVGGNSVVGYVIASFSIEHRSAIRPTTAGRTLTVESDGMAHADVKEWLGSAPNALQSGRVDSYLGAAADGVITAAKFAAGALDAVWSVGTRILTAATNITSTGGTTVPQTGDSFARLGAPAGASVSADVAAVKTTADAIEVDTQDIQSRLPAALVSGRMSSDAVAISGSTAAADAVETNIGNLDDAVSDAVAAPAAALTAYDPPTYAELVSEINDVQSDIAVVDANVDTLLTRITATLFSGITSLGQWLGLMAGKQTGNATALTEIRATGAGSGTFDPTTDSEEAIRDRGDAAWTTGTAPSAAAVADAVWDEARAGHAGAGTFGEGVASVQGPVTGDVQGNVDGSVDSVTQGVAVGTGGIQAASFAAGAIDAGALATDAVEEVADGVWDEQVDGAVTARQSMRLANSANGGKVAGAATTTVTVRDLADTKDRVTATVDADGNRTAVTRDLS